MLSLAMFRPAIVEAQVSSKEEAEDSPQELLYEMIETGGIEQALAWYSEQKESEDSSYELDGRYLNRLGYRLLNEERIDQAVAVFAFNTKMHPATVNYWDSLNDGYLAAGEYGKAAGNYRKILSMLDEQELPPRLENLLRSKAEFNLYKTEHFAPPSEETFNYVSYYGGNPAGKREMEDIARFNGMNPDLKISFIGNNYYSSPVPSGIADIFGGEHPADVVSGAIGGYFLRFAAQGRIADITGLWEEQEWDRMFTEPFRKMSASGGKKYFVPTAYQWNPVWYRKDIFDRHNLAPPGSWQELLELCDRLNELGYAPFSISVQNWPPPTARWFTILNLRLNGADFHRRVTRGEVAFTDDRIRSVFEHWRELFRHGAFADTSYTWNYRNGIRALTSGDAVMYNLGEWIFESLDKQQGANLDFFAFPPIAPGVEQAEIVHAYGAFMTADTRDRHPEAAESLLTWLAGTESQAGIVRTNSRTVANTGVADSLYSDLQRRLTHYVNGVEEFVPLLELSMDPEMARPALEVFQEYWENPEEIDAALQKLEAARSRVAAGDP